MPKLVLTWSSVIVDPPKLHFFCWTNARGVYYYSILKNSENTVFGYKKGSKSKSKKSDRSATPILCIFSLIRMLNRWVEHTCRGGSKNTPFLLPPHHEKWQFEKLCLKTIRDLREIWTNEVTKKLSHTTHRLTIFNRN